MMKKFLQYTSKLKHLPRTGWLRHNISFPESVAAHSWQMAMIALKLSQTEEKYDFNKVIKLCLCHDMGESVIGDITPNDSRYKDKKQMEQEAVDKIAQDGNIPEIKALFMEYEEALTPEAKLANDLDKLDMYVQSLDYENKYPQKDLSEFRQSAVAAIKTDIGKALLKELV